MHTATRQDSCIDFTPVERTAASLTNSIALSTTCEDKHSLEHICLTCSAMIAQLNLMGVVVDVAIAVGVVIAFVGVVVYITVL